MHASTQQSASRPQHAHAATGRVDQHRACAGQHDRFRRARHRGRTGSAAGGAGGRDGAQRISRVELQSGDHWHREREQHDQRPMACARIGHADPSACERGHGDHRAHQRRRERARARHRHASAPPRRWQAVHREPERSADRRPGQCDAASSAATPQGSSDPSFSARSTSAIPARKHRACSDDEARGTARPIQAPTALFSASARPGCHRARDAEQRQQLGFGRRRHFSADREVAHALWQRQRLLDVLRIFGPRVAHDWSTAMNDVYSVSR